MTDNWIMPAIVAKWNDRDRRVVANRSEYFDADELEIIHPNPYPGIEGYDRLLVDHVDDPRCTAVHPDMDGIGCALVEGHVGPHWPAPQSFTDKVGTLRIVAELVAS